jgi:DNA adenine methylase
MTINKSFLKWAGGKKQSVGILVDLIGPVTGRFVEPFVGSCVVSLNVNSSKYILCDINNDLINLYNILKEDDNFINDLRYFFSFYNNDSRKYYECRELFNNTKDLRLRSLLFVYLNRHCFNGLCRYNKSGLFNVPFGKYKRIYFPEVELLNFRESLVNKSELYCQSFEKTFEMLENEDVCYCDPPYVPVSRTSNFSDYSVGGFSNEQQILLAKLAEKSSCKIFISNSDTDFTRDIYSKADEIRTIKVSRFISANTDSRKPVYELLAIYNKEK